MQLYSYYRSTAAYRVRIALHYKKLTYQSIPIDLSQGKQLETEYRVHNPQGRVPTLIDGELETGQSMAILEYLEEQYPQPPLLPSDVKGRVWVRCFSQIIACDMHPLNNMGPLKFLREEFKFSEEQIVQWYHHWLKQGFDALEMLLEKNKNRQNFCWGHLPTFADICLIPQVYNANRFNFSMTNYPLISAVNQFCLQLPYFENAKPENEPDAKKPSKTAVS